MILQYAPWTWLLTSHNSIWLSPPFVLHGIACYNPCMPLTIWAKHDPCLIFFAIWTFLTKCLCMAVITILWQVSVCVFVCTYCLWALRVSWICVVPKTPQPCPQLCKTEIHLLSFPLWFYYSIYCTYCVSVSVCWIFYSPYSWDPTAFDRERRGRVSHQSFNHAISIMHKLQMTW